MIKYKCTVPDDPPDSYGDCHRCCVATILGLDPSEVPHFYHDYDGVKGNKRIQKFLASWGLEQVTVQFPGHMPIPEIIDGGHRLSHAAILGGWTEHGTGHSVVVWKGEIYNNPSDAEIIGPFPDSDNYELSFFVALPDFAIRPRR